MDTENLNEELDEIPVFNEHELSLWERILRFVAEHKVLSIVTVIGLPILMFVIGAKCCSKTVQKLPDPGIMDKFDLVPKDGMIMANFEFVPKVIETTTEQQ